MPGRDARFSSSSSHLLLCECLSAALHFVLVKPLRAFRLHFFHPLHRILSGYEKKKKVISFYTFFYIMFLLLFKKIWTVVAHFFWFVMFASMLLCLTIRTSPLRATHLPVFLYI